MRLFELYQEELIASAVIFVTAVVIRWSLIKVIKKTAAITNILDRRRNLVIKYMSILITILTVISMFVVWGVKAHNVIAAMSAIVTVIGIAFFAQWSILSNITAGMIVFFSFPFKIGDYIKVEDGEHSLEGEILDIRAFHTLIRSTAGIVTTYPNNLLLQKGVSILPTPTQTTEFTD
ncbi:MAG: mechanosensitive ion channel domain-containing protein [Flavobacterium sp.]